MRLCLLVMAFFLAAVTGLQAATGPKMGPRDSWSEMQKYEYYIGQLAAALNLCRHHDLAYEVKAIADLSPYGRKGWKSLQSFDGTRGGRCTKYAESGRKILEDGTKLRSFLTEAYD